MPRALQVLPNSLAHYLLIPHLLREAEMCTCRLHEGARPVLSHPNLPSHEGRRPTPSDRRKTTHLPGA